jgi:hypothetical protein
MDLLARDLSRIAGAGAWILEFAPRGIGPHRETWLDFVPLVESDLAYDAFLLGDCLPAIRAADAIAAARTLIRMPGVDTRRLAILGCGRLALSALLAGAAEAGITTIVEREGLWNLSSLAWHKCRTWNVSVIVPKILTVADLPEIRRWLSRRAAVHVLDPRDHLGAPLAMDFARLEDSVHVMRPRFPDDWVDIVGVLLGLSGQS